MDRKALTVLAVSFLLIMGWFELVKHRYPPAPPEPESTNLVALATNVTGPNASAGGTNRTPAPALPKLSAPTPGAVFVAPAAAEQLVVFETLDVRYTFTSHGGGVKLVELKHFKEAVDCTSRQGDATNKLATLNTRAPVPVLALLGGDTLQDEAPFQLTKSATGVRAEKLLTNGLFITKEFRPGTNHLMTVTTRVENRSGQPVLLPPQEWVLGTATPINAQDTGILQALDWYNGVKAEQTTESWFANRTLGCFPGTPHTLFTAEGQVVWAGVQNQFFTIIAMPKEPAPQVVARRIDLPPAPKTGTDADAKAVPHPFGFQAALVYPGVRLGTEADKNFVQHEFTLFTGPKEYNNLAKIGLHFKNNLDLVMNYGGFFGFFAKGLLLSMNGLHGLGLPYALCIIAITVLIKLLFWPLTAASTKSMKRMQELQPQIKLLQEKYKEDSAKMNQKMMEFWKENKVNPMSGCLPMMIQIPVFIGFYTMLRGAIELRGEHFLWACDLSQPDTVAYAFGFPVNPLPLIMGVTMLWQSSLTPPSPGMDPVQQKMMKYMPVIFIFALYTMSAGLTLYWTVQNLLTILQMKLTKSNTQPAGLAPAVTPAKKKKKA